jgi:hypothetical protein
VKEEMSNNQTTALVPLNQYAIATRSKEELANIVAGNLAGEQLTAMDFDKIKLPSGGALVWTVPGLEGPKYVNEIVGVIIAVKTMRGYWAQSIEDGGAGKPPDCASDGGVTGKGNPGGACADCALNTFGSAGEGEAGKACKEMRFVFMLQPETLLPSVVVLAPTSIKPMKQYLLRLSSQAIPYWGVQTALALEGAKNGQNIAYAKVSPKLVAKLSADEAMHVQGYAAMIRNLIDKVGMDAGDYFVDAQAQPAE